MFAHKSPTHCTNRTTARRRAARGGTLAVCLVSLMSAAMPSQAAAASQISGCFGYGGYAISGLATEVSYAYRGRWYPLKGSVGATDDQGCVAYDISRPWQGTRMMIAAAGVVSSWNSVVWGTTPYGSPAGSGTWDLGTATLNTLQLEEDQTWKPGDWTSGMGNTSTSMCNSSPAAMIRCDMDRKGMVANGVVLPLDTDGDKVYDTEDAYPQDNYRS